MPTAPKRPCSRAGCPELQPCSTHKPHTAPGQTYRERRRAEPWRSIYDTQRWRKLRKDVLARSPLCVDCVGQQRVTLATVVDHVIPHRGDMRLAFDFGNLQTLCDSCHGRKTARETLNARTA